MGSEKGIKFMTEETFWQLIATGESESVEFKTAFDKEAIEALVAFANTKGGSVINGVKYNKRQPDHSNGPYQ